MSIYENIKTIIVDSLGKEEDKVNKKVNLRDDLLLDSVDLVELIVELEDILHINIPVDELWEVQTIEDLEELIKYKNPKYD